MLQIAATPALAMTRDDSDLGIAGSLAGNVITSDGSFFRVVLEAPGPVPGGVVMRP